MEIINHKLLFKSYFIWYIIANGPHVQLIKYFHTEKKGETKSLSLDWYQLSTSYTSLPVLLIKGTWIDGATDKAWHMGLSWATVRKNLAWNDQSTLYICQLILSLYQPPSQVPWRTFSCSVIPCMAKQDQLMSFQWCQTRFQLACAGGIHALVVGLASNRGYLEQISWGTWFLMSLFFYLHQQVQSASHIHKVVWHYEGLVQSAPGSRPGVAYTVLVWRCTTN